MAERARLAAIVAQRYASKGVRAATAPVRAFGRMRMRAPERLLIAPQDIRTADATRAEDIYAGYFAFGGRIVNTQGRSPFDLHPPSAEWARALNGFGWLRHLRAAETSLARVNARALVDDYLAARSRGPAEPFDAATTARRILSWLSQSTLVLEGAEAEFYHRFLRALARDAGQLQDALGATSGLPHLLSTIALAAYAMCAETPARFQSRASAQLAEAVGAQILPDGGHVSRNPQVLVDLLLDFLPLRQAYVARGAARQTAAHSTLVIDDVSSCRIAPDTGIERVIAGQIVAGPVQVGVKRETLDEGALLDLSHDGYAQRFGLVHERRIALKSDGAQLVGEDRLVAAAQTAQTPPETFALRFHLHPSVVAMRAGDDTAVVLDLADGQRWMFDAGGLAVSLEESVFFASPDGVRACQQIVVTGKAEATVEVQWAMSRL